MMNVRSGYVHAVQVEPSTPPGSVFAHIWTKNGRLLSFITAPLSAIVALTNVRTTECVRRVISQRRYPNGESKACVDQWAGRAGAGAGGRCGGDWHFGTGG